ncbi:hypothetical protein HID58_031992, partial [Brassica napus]
MVFIDLGLLHYLRFLGFTNATQIKLTDVTDPMVNEKVADRELPTKFTLIFRSMVHLNELPTKFTLSPLLHW